MKAALIITLMFAFAGCATNQSLTSHSRTSARTTDEFEHPELIGMTREQIARLLWRVQYE
jgi:hypothetical protein